MTEKDIINNIVWWIPFKKLRSAVRDYMLLTLASRKEMNESIVSTRNELNEFITFFKDTLPKEIEFRKSALADKYLKGLRGIEIGGATYANFGLNTINIDYSDDPESDTILYQIAEGVVPLKVDIVSPGDDLPFKDNTFDFIFNSHAFEHFFDSIKALKEWMRVIRPGGFIFMIVPHKERTFDKDRERTPLQELIDRHEGNIEPPNPMTYGHHHSVWITEDVLELCEHLGYNVLEYQDVDDAVGNGFAIVIQK